MTDLVTRIEAFRRDMKRAAETFDRVGREMERIRRRMTDPDQPGHTPENHEDFGPQQGISK